jgi:hypothetical protein
MRESMKSLRLLLVAIACPVIALLAWQSAAAESRIALVIGNGAYARLPQLLNPVNDAQTMESTLRDFGFEVIRLENATKTEIEAGIAEFTQRLTPDAVGLVYYAGHGVQMGGRNYLIPVDAVIQAEGAVRTQAVDLGEVLDRIAYARARATIVILDACRDSPFDRPEKTMTLADGGGGRGGPARAANGRFRSISPGLAQVDAPSGILIAYATAPGKVASDGSGANGLYTAELVRAMAIAGASIEEVFKQARLAVIQKSGGKQIPWESSSLTISFTFRLGAPPTASMRPATPFDGVWKVSLLCSATSSTGGYTMDFPAQVESGIFRGEVGVGGHPGWTKFEGRVLADGTADIYGSGLTGASATTLGGPPPGSSASYHYVTRFDGSRATGTRADNRPCSFTASKM